MAAFDQGALSKYNSLTDRHLVSYFSNDRMRHHLIKNGLITKNGEVVPDAVYRVKMARREHRRRVRDLIAQAIIHKALEMERSRQIDIRKKIEEIAKIELVRRVREDRARIGDEDCISYFSPGNMDIAPRIGLQKKRTQSDFDEYRLPATPDEKSRLRLKKLLPNEEIESKHLSQLDSLTLGEYSKILLKQDQKRINKLPYLGLGKSTNGKKSKKFKSKKSQKTQKKEASLNEELLQSSRSNQSKVQSMTKLSILFHAPIQSRSYEVMVEQQPSGGNTLILYRNALTNNSIFSVISHRHKGFPFSLTFYINNVKDSRISTCCEYKHKIGKRIGGPNGHFSLFSVEGASPCFRCLTEQDMKNEEKKSGKKNAKSKDQESKQHESISVGNNSDSPYQSDNQFESDSSSESLEESDNDENEEENNQSNKSSRSSSRNNLQNDEENSKYDSEEPLEIAVHNSESTRENEIQSDENQIINNNNNNAVNNNKSNNSSMESNLSDSEFPVNSAGITVTYSAKEKAKPVENGTDIKESNKDIKDNDKINKNANTSSFDTQNVKSKKNNEFNTNNDVKIGSMENSKDKLLVKNENKEIEGKEEKQNEEVVELDTKVRKKSATITANFENEPKTSTQENRIENEKKNDMAYNSGKQKENNLINLPTVSSERKLPEDKVEEKNSVTLTAKFENEPKTSTQENRIENEKKNNMADNSGKPKENNLINLPTVSSERKLPEDKVEEKKIIDENINKEISSSESEDEEKNKENYYTPPTNQDKRKLSESEDSEDNEIAATVKKKTVNPINKNIRKEKTTNVKLKTYSSDSEEEKEEEEENFSSSSEISSSIKSPFPSKSNKIDSKPLSTVDKGDLKIDLPKDDNESNKPSPSDRLYNGSNHRNSKDLSDKKMESFDDDKKITPTTISDSSSESESESEDETLDQPNIQEVQKDISPDIKPNETLPTEDIIIQNDDINFKKAKELIQRFMNININSFKITSCELPSYVFNFIAEKLELHHELKSIELSECEVEISLLNLLAKSLDKWPKLEQLILSNNQFVDYSLQNLIDKIKFLYQSDEHINRHKQNLKMFDLSNCSIKENDFGLVTDMIKSNTRIDHIAMNGNQISLEMLKDICNALKVNTQTETISLENCGIFQSMLEQLTELSDGVKTKLKI